MTRTVPVLAHTRLTGNQTVALKAWLDTDSDFDVLSFADIASRSGLPRHQVRRTVRDMARKGVTQYVRGCWTDDGSPAGSGYGLTKEGRELLFAGEECEALEVDGGLAAHLGMVD